MGCLRELPLLHFLELVIRESGATLAFATEPFVSTLTDLSIEFVGFSQPLPTAELAHMQQLRAL